MSKTPSLVLGVFFGSARRAGPAPAFFRDSLDGLDNPLAELLLEFEQRKDQGDS